MRGLVAYSALTNKKLNFTIEELTRQKVCVNFGWGIMTLKKKLKENETLNEESDPNYFKPLFMSADDWAEPEKVSFESKYVSYNLKNKHLSMVRKELQYREVPFHMRDGIRALIKKLKDSEEDGVEEEYCNKLGFIPRFKSPRTWEAVSRLGTAVHQEGPPTNPN